MPVNNVGAGLAQVHPSRRTSLTGIVQNYLLQATTPSNTDRVNVHVLHTINAKFNFNGSYNFNSQRSNTLSNFAGIGGNQLHAQPESDALALSHNWTPHVVESTSVNWSRNRVQTPERQFLQRAFSPASSRHQSGHPAADVPPVDYGIPQVSFSNFSGFSDPIPSLVRNQTLRFDDNLTWTHAKHTMRFGGEIRRVQLNTDSNPNPRGGFVFTGIATGNDFADFLEGLPSTPPGSSAIRIPISAVGDSTSTRRMISG